MQENLSLKAIPQELKLNGLWCCWRLTEKGKVPYNVKTGEFARSNDKETFAPYATMLNHLNEYLIIGENGTWQGGVGLGIFNGFSAVDIDDCVDENGAISPMAQDIIDHIDSYTELSPSKRGIRIIFKTPIKIDKSKYYINNANNGLEIYISDNTNKFVTITGNAIKGGVGINEVDITYILDKYMQKGNSFELALKKDKKLNDLWNASAPGSNANESEMDMALCTKLAYYLKGDFNEIDSMFMQSPYFASKDEAHKKKWLQRKDYRIQTINNAISFIQVSESDKKGFEVSSKQSYELNDTGNSKRFIARFGNILKYNVDNNKWMIYNGKYWQHDVHNNVKNYVEIVAEEMLHETNMETDLPKKQQMLKNINRIYNSAGKESLLKEAQHIIGVPCTNNDFDNNEFILNCENGVIDLKTGTLTPHDRNLMLSMETLHPVDTTATPKRWISFLNDIFDNNQDLISYMQKVLGYSLTGSTKEQVMFVLYGDGRNGKSLMLDVIREALGGYGITTRPMLLTEQRNGNTNTEEIARLKGKRIVFSEETKIGDKLDESLIKTLTSGIGNVVARFLYGNSFEFSIIGKIFMATNHRPVIRGTDYGIWRRIHIIPFNRVFEGKDDDKDLRYKLRAEIPAILNWLIQGCLLWQKEGLEAPQAVKASTQEYRSEMDIIQKWVDERCEVHHDLYEKGADLFADFTNYATINKEFIMSNTLFGRNLVKKFERKRIGAGNVYMGLRLRKGNENIHRRVQFERIKIDEKL
jgi:putative DNA primase/helicase